jgi:hypothetical protein
MTGQKAQRRLTILFRKWNFKAAGRPRDRSREPPWALTPRRLPEFVLVQPCTSFTWVAMYHLLPNASFTPALRSP